MINEYYAKQYCCDDLSLIENYDLAIADTTQTWFCHHILGEQHSRQYLIDNNLYESRPANELRFVTHADHQSLHHKGVPLSEATKQKLSKKILQYTKSGEFIKEWSSMREVERVLGIAHSGVCKCCKGKIKFSGGYIWKYAI